MATELELAVLTATAHQIARRRHWWPGFFFADQRSDGVPSPIATAHDAAGRARDLESLHSVGSITT
jgi:hypothetical protein